MSACQTNENSEAIFGYKLNPKSLERFNMATAKNGLNLYFLLDAGLSNKDISDDFENPLTMITLQTTRLKSRHKKQW